MLTVAPIGKTKRVTRRSNFNVSSKHRNVTGNDAALKSSIILFVFCFLKDLFFLP